MAEHDSGKPERTVMAALARSGVSDLLRRAEETAAWDQVLRRCLPDALARHCGLVSWGDGKLLFQASSPVWKNKLRLHSRELLDCANAAGLHALEIRIRINPDFPGHG